MNSPPGVLNLQKLRNIQKVHSSHVINFHVLNLNGNPYQIKGKLENTLYK
jgi:hypothetical protein